jgi:uncharacterized membrane protein YbhN (UPF0104 family)
VTPALAFVRRHVRGIGLALLLVVTAYGVSQLERRDIDTVLYTWRNKTTALAIALALAGLDIVLDWAVWTWLCRFFRIRVLDFRGVAIFFSAHAGLLVPMKLGNLIRPDGIVQLRRGTLADALRVEAVAFYFDGAGAAAVIVGAIATILQPTVGWLAGLAVLAGLYVAGERITQVLDSEKIGLPRAFWWRWQTPLILLISASSWLVHGLVLHVLVGDLMPDARLVESILYVALASLLGAGTGMPGGIGAIEGLLGVSLAIMHLPAKHLAFAVGAFRLVTFWIWIPIGWIALAWVNQVKRRNALSGGVASSAQS